MLSEDFISSIIQQEKEIFIGYRMQGVEMCIRDSPLLEQVSGETYGVMIYQEQVQAAAKLLAGYTLGGACLLYTSATWWRAAFPRY